MRSSDLIFTSASSLARLISTRQVSATEVLQAHLDRIANVNGAINAVVQLAPDALDRARQADRQLARAEALRTLHGAPFTVKDNTETAGVVTAAGVRERAAGVPRKDATVFARMRAAGGILIGRTKLPSLG